MKGKKDNKSSTYESDRILISFYLSTDTLERLDDVLFYARKSLPIGRRRRLTKSILYEIALKMLIENYHVEGDKSILMKTISQLAES